MNIVYTYWSNGIKNIDCGFSHTELFFLCAEKSLRSSLKTIDGNGDVIIFTDKCGFGLLKNNIKNVKGVKVVIVDFSKYDFDERFWNFPKMVTYTLQKEPFIHIDFDVILQPNFYKNAVKQDGIITEKTRRLYRNSDSMTFVLDVFDEKGDKMKTHNILCSGLIGTTDMEYIDAFKENFEVAKEYCKNGFHDKVDFINLWGIEEYNFTKIVENKKYPVACLAQSTYRHYTGNNKYDNYYDEIKNLEI